MVTVSIIVPVHNSVAYLDRCVQSCLKQTLEDIELILVDDASSDDSPALIREYAEAYPDRVVGIYLPENIRQGGARNRGLEAAQGEYIAFVDSDDWVDPEFCRCLYAAAKEAKADMVGETSLYVEYGEETKLQVLDYRTSPLTDPQELHQYMVSCGYFWNRIYKREWLLENGVFFPERLAFEDSYFNTIAALYATSVVAVDAGFYHYYQSADSTVRSKGKPHLYDKIAIAELIWTDCKAWGLYEAYRDEIDIKCISILANTLFYICLESFERPNKKKMAALRNVLWKHGKEWFRNPYLKELPAVLRVFLRLNTISPLLAVSAYWGGLHKWIELASVAHKKIQKRKR